MKQYNLDGIVERSSAMMEALSVETEMFYRGYMTTLDAYEYTRGEFRIEVVIFCENYNEQCEIAQYLENHPARHQGTITTNERNKHYWVSYQIVH